MLDFITQKFAELYLGAGDDVGEAGFSDGLVAFYGAGEI